MKKWRLRVVNAYSGSTINSKKRRELKDKKVFVRFYREKNNSRGKNWKRQGERAKKYTKELEWFYNTVAKTNHSTIKIIATDACKELKRVVRNIPYSKWFFSKLHAVRDVCRVATGRLFLVGKTKKKEAGYYDFLEGKTNKMVNFFKEKKQTTLVRMFWSKAERNKEGIETWKTAKFGYNAESEVSKIRKYLNNGRNIYSPLTFARKLEANGYIVKM